MNDLHAIFLHLREVAVLSAPSMKLSKDTMGEIMLSVPQDVLDARDPVWFASVRLNASNIAFYLPPLAMKECRDLVVSTQLRARATGRTCFQFSRNEPALFDELAHLTAKADELLRPTKSGLAA